MQYFYSVFLLLHICSVNSVILKSTMNSDYPQIAVLGCDSKKANLYYDVQRKVWVEHLISPCVNSEKSILEFCQQAYPSLNIGNIIRLDTVLRFTNWCELIPTTDDSIPRCKTDGSLEELVQPYRCLNMNAKREELMLPNIDCNMNSISINDECLSSEKLRQLASTDCLNRSMSLNTSLMTSDWCGLGQFRGIEYVCCPNKDDDTKNDYETSLDEQEDDPVNDGVPLREVVLVPKASTNESPRRIIAMSLGTREPNWMEDYRAWNTESGYFADDDDVDDDQEEIKLSSTRKSHLTINEHERFTNDKNAFKKKYQEQIDQLTNRWQKRQNEIQNLANQNSLKAQKEYEKTEFEFRQEYEMIKQTAIQERARINQLHEDNLDAILSNAKIETNKKLDNVWNEKPLKAENIEEALYNYLHVLLRDRIHLVNRYERLRAIDPEQAKRKRISIHERLRSIANQINSALNRLRLYSDLQSKIQPRIDNLFAEYDEVNKAADRLVADYISTVSTTMKNRNSPLGQDEDWLYPFKSSWNRTSKTNENNEYEYDGNDVYDDNDDDDDDDEDSTMTIDANKNDKSDTGVSDWDFNIDSNQEIIKPDETMYDDSRTSLVNKDLNRFDTRNQFVTYLPYIIGCLFVLCLIFAFLVLRLIIQQRRKSRYGNNYDKTYAFTEVDSCTPEEKTLHKLQLNGYENPTYKFFENQPSQC